MKINISVKLTLLFTTLLTVTAALMFYIYTNEMQERLKLQILTELTQAAHGGMSDIDRFMYERLSDVRGLAASGMLQNSQDYARIDAELQGFIKSKPIYYSLSYFDVNRVRQADTKGLSLGVQHSMKTYWLGLSRGQKYVMDISRSESVGESVMHFACQVYDEQGNHKGTLVARVLLSRLYEAFLVDEDGNSYLQNPDLHLDLVNGSGILLYSNHQPQGVLQKRYENMRMLHHMSRKGLLYIEQGDKVYVMVRQKGYLNFKGYKWSLLVSVPMSSVFRPLLEAKQRMYLTMLPVLLISMGLTVLASRYITIPIRRLTKAAKRIGKGELHAMEHVNYSRRDEVGTLATTLNHMATELQVREEEQQRYNAELATMNSMLSDQLGQIQEQKEEISTQNAVLEDTYKELQRRNDQQLASIHYAKRIQEAMLPKDHVLQSVFPSSYIYYSPKDIVSGDFYWFDRVRNREQDLFIIAAADCTGHGVPGAMMSMLGSNLLSRIILHDQLYEPSAILKRLDKAVKEELHQQDGQLKDGMEIALAVIDLKNLHMSFSGAGRPLYILRDGALQVLESAKVSVGGAGLMADRRDPEQLLTCQKFQLLPGDLLYFFSDGYVDQLGGPQGRRFSVKRFQALLGSIAVKSSEEQLQYLQLVYEGWKGNERQLDDVMVVCLKI